MPQLQFSRTINAPADRIWHILWQPSTLTQWASIIDPGTYMEGQLQEGSLIQFISTENGYGVTSLVKKMTAPHYLLLLHQADTQQSGKQSRPDQWTGGQEEYVLEQKGDQTTLTISFDAPDELEAYFQECFPKVLDKIASLSEIEV